MRASRKRLGTFLSAWIVLLAATTVSAQQPVKTAEGFRPEGLSAINARLRGAVDRKEIAGAVALLMRDGKVSVLEAVGQRDDGAPLTPDTIFWKRSPRQV
jgi:CubicO group peptidase (beta-lactamase class C family)